MSKSQDKSISRVINTEIELSSVGKLLDTRASLKDNFDFVFQGIGFGESKITSSILLKVLLQIDDIQRFIASYPNLLFKFDTGFYGADWDKIKDTSIGDYLIRWYQVSKNHFDTYVSWLDTHHIDDHIKFSNGTLIGAGAGLVLGTAFDNIDLVTDVSLDDNSIAEGLIRFASGNGDNIGGVFQRIKNRVVGGVQNSHIDSFSAGTVIGMSVGPLLQLFSDGNSSGNLLLDALYTSAYSNADNFGGALGYLTSKCKEKGFTEGIRHFISNPYQATNFIAIITFFVINLVFLSRFGYVLDSQILKAIHGTLLNFDSPASVMAVRIANANRIGKLYKATTDKVLLSTLKGLSSNLQAV